MDFLGPLITICTIIFLILYQIFDKYNISIVIDWKQNIHFCEARGNRVEVIQQIRFNALSTYARFNNYLWLIAKENPTFISFGRNYHYFVGKNNKMYGFTALESEKLTTDDLDERTANAVTARVLSERRDIVALHFEAIALTFIGALIGFLSGYFLIQGGML